MNTSHYPSLELCKKLRDINFPFSFEVVHAFGQLNINDSPDFQNDTEWCPTPSVMEMLDVMPRNIKKIDGFVAKTHIKYTLGLHDTSEAYRIYYASYHKTLIYIQNRSLPNALAEMIIYLHENNYISFSK